MNLLIILAKVYHKLRIGIHLAPTVTVNLHKRVAQNMDKIKHQSVDQTNQLGFHYFPDTYHYRESDLMTWLPELKTLNAGWLVLQADSDRAIPEPFLSGLQQARITPILQFNLPYDPLPDYKGLRTIIEVYAKWGIQYIQFFNRPNQREFWSTPSWAQSDLVDRFLDRFLPLATMANQLGIVPLFPALEPGGSYWDTAFLRSSLEALQRRNQPQILENLVLSAYAWSHNHPLRWGAGGPERWPATRPYILPTDSEDQRGFYIFDWYQAIAKAVLQKSCPIMLFGAGSPFSPERSGNFQRSESHNQYLLALLRLIDGETVADPEKSDHLLEPLSQEVLACNIWLLSAESNSPYCNQSWYTSVETPTPIVQMVKEWRANGNQRGIRKSMDATWNSPSAEHPIRHYLLLPILETGVSEWYLDVIRPYVRRYRPTIGFSFEEAKMAARVTVIGNARQISEERLSRLRQAGCQVERISGDGISIATQITGR